MRRALGLSLVSLSLAALACSGAAPPPNGAGGAGGGAASSLVVDTDKGPIEGIMQGEETRAFLGVPYAAPPVGDLRWRRPVPHEAWTEVRSAQLEGRPCTQNGLLSPGYDPTTGEDCLTLNVWAPSEATEPRPVLVWIHGGGFVLGSGSDDAYDGRLLSEHTGAVVVGINYRLGALGFLSLPELEEEDAEHGSTGSYGIEDQRAALAWVQANIAAMGGDPDNVTIFGESAGAISTCYHMLSPPSQGLFHRAIIQSGPCESANDPAEAKAQGAELAAVLGCGDAATGVDLACLRGKSEQEVLEALPGGLDFFFGEGPSWFPIVDGYNLPAQPAALLAAGDFAKVPTIVGANADEGTIFFTLGDTEIPDEATFETLAEELVPGHGAEIVALYPTATYGSAKAAAMAAVGDGGFVCPTRRLARTLEAGGAPTFLYHFSYAPAGVLLGDDLGAFHSAELRYVFGNPGQLTPFPLDPTELELSHAIMGYWGRLAASGDPNADGAVVWPAFETESDLHLGLDVEQVSASGLASERCDYWDTVTVAL